jgi:hypothetical protein
MDNTFIVLIYGNQNMITKCCLFYILEEHSQLSTIFRCRLTTKAPRHNAPRLGHHAS